MVSSPSIRSSSRARTSNQRGFVLFVALVIAVLYLALIELLWMDGTRSFQEAQRFRARVVAASLAENAAELAAENLIAMPGAKVSDADSQGTMEGELTRAGEQFELRGTAVSAGVIQEKADVHLQGRVVGTRVAVDYSKHG